MSKALHWRQLAVHHAMQHLRWLLERDIMVWEQIYGVVVSYFMLWFVAICLLRTQKHLTYTKRLWVLSIRCLNSSQDNVKTWSEEFLTQIQRADLQWTTSGTIHGLFKSKIEIAIWAISQERKKCLLMISYMIKSLKNLTLIRNTLKNVLKIIVTITLQLAIILLIKETRNLRIDKKAISSQRSISKRKWG